MLAKHTHSESAAWICRDINPDHALRACFAVIVGQARYVPGSCDECGDTMVDLATRNEEINFGTCAKCGAVDTFIYYDGCRDSLTLLRLVAVAMFGEEPEETLECESCRRTFELQYFRCDGKDVCSFCLESAVHQ